MQSIAISQANVNLPQTVGLGRLAKSVVEKLFSQVIFGSRIALRAMFEPHPVQDHINEERMKSYSRSSIPR